MGSILIPKSVGVSYKSDRIIVRNFEMKKPLKVQYQNDSVHNFHINPAPKIRKGFQKSMPSA